MKLNQSKRHLMISSHKFEAFGAKIRETQIWERREQRLLGVDIANDNTMQKSREKIKCFSKTINFF